VVRTLDTRGCCTDRELASLPEFRDQDVELLLEELVGNYEIIAVEFQHEANPEVVRTVYFPLGTCVYEPGLRVKKGLPNTVLEGLHNLKERGIVNDDMLQNVPRHKLVEFHDAVKEHIVGGKKLTAGEAARILKKVMGTI